MPSPAVPLPLRARARQASCSPSWRIRCRTTAIHLRHRLTACHRHPTPRFSSNPTISLRPPPPPRWWPADQTSPLPDAGCTVRLRVDDGSRLRMPHRRHHFRQASGRPNRLVPDVVLEDSVTSRYTSSTPTDTSRQSARRRTALRLRDAWRDVSRGWRRRYRRGRRRHLD